MCTLQTQCGCVWRRERFSQQVRYETAWIRSNLKGLGAVAKNLSPAGSTGVNYLSLRPLGRSYNHTGLSIHRGSNFQIIDVNIVSSHFSPTRPLVRYISSASAAKCIQVLFFPSMNQSQDFHLVVPDWPFLDSRSKSTKTKIIATGSCPNRVPDLSG